MNKTAASISIMLLALTLPAAASERAEVAAAKDVAARDLKDPTSAQFRNLRIAGTGDKATVCGEINGKNSYGGYVGFRKFVVAANTAIIEPAPDSSGIHSATMELINHLCKDAIPV